MFQFQAPCNDACLAKQSKMYSESDIHYSLFFSALEILTKIQTVRIFANLVLVIDTKLYHICRPHKPIWS